MRRSSRALARSPVKRARSHLRAFRKASILAVALTAFVLLFADPAAGGAAQPRVPGFPAAQADTAVVDTTVVDSATADSLAAAQAAEVEEDTATPRPDSLARESAREARRTLRSLGSNFVGYLPKLGIALAVFLLAGILIRLLRPLLRKALASFQRADAYTALFAIAIWLMALGIAASVLAGDIRALLGSIGLIGLALSWALQTPIESFTGWLLNSFRGYYRVGDRIAVGDVFGDVYRIDVLTTTVWEYGGADRPPGQVRAEQPTGRLITFPNNEILTGTVVNYTRDFPWVWDELAVSVANESDLRYATQVLRGVAVGALGDYMAEPAAEYRAVLQRARVDVEISDAPEVFASLDEWGTTLTVRYLVEARRKRAWKSELTLRVSEELARPEHAGRILPVYPRQQVQWVDEGGAPVPPSPTTPGAPVPSHPSSDG